MNNSSANAAASGRTAGNAATNINNPNEAPTARGFFNPGLAGPSGGGRSFNAIPAQREASRSSSRGPSRGAHGRGRNPSRTPYTPRRQPQQPKLPKTYNGGQLMPNSAAELEAYGKAMAEYAKELANYSEAIEGQGRSQIRAQKRSHPGGENGNYDSNPGYPVASAQNRENAKSSPSSKLPSLTSANPNGRALPNSVLLTLQNSVLQTPQNSVLQTLPQPLNDEFLIEFASSNHPAQLSLIRRLDREQRDRRTSNSRCVDIAVFLRRIEVLDPVVETPEARRPALAKNGKPTVEVLTMYSSKDEQLPLTSGDFDCIMGVAVAFIEKLPKGKTYPEWNWASWCNKYRGQLAMASEGQAVLVAALFNSPEVPGVVFHLWRESEIRVLTPVKIILDKGFMLSWTDEMVM
jgi:hypothetical protein